MGKRKRSEAVPRLALPRRTRVMADDNAGPDGQAPICRRDPGDDPSISRGRDHPLIP